MSRGRVYKDQDTWIAEVIHRGGSILWSDNSGPGTQPMMFRDCYEVAAAFAVSSNKGQVIDKSWGQIVREAPSL